MAKRNEKGMKEERKKEPKRATVNNPYREYRQDFLRFAGTLLVEDKKSNSLS